MLLVNYRYIVEFFIFMFEGVVNFVGFGVVNFVGFGVYFLVGIQFFILIGVIGGGGGVIGVYLFFEDKIFNNVFKMNIYFFGKNNY